VADLLPFLSRAARRDSRRIQEVREFLEHAPELAPVEVTDGITWTLLSKPYPEACALLCEIIRKQDRAKAAADKNEGT